MKSDCIVFDENRFNRLKVVSQRIGGFDKKQIEKVQLDKPLNLLTKVK